jgi:hypothetical protein
MMTDSGIVKMTMPMASIHGVGALAQLVADEVDAHMGVLQHHVAHAEHEHGGEQVPLDFQEGVGADVEGLAHDGVGGADQHGGQHQPHGELADQRVHRIDGTRQFQERLHGDSCTTVWRVDGAPGRAGIHANLRRPMANLQRKARLYASLRPHWPENPRTQGNPRLGYPWPAGRAT